MRLLTARELVFATRTPAVPFAGLVVMGLSTAFVGAWAPGVPMLAPMSLYDQTLAVQWVVLAVVLPWTAVRSSPMDRADAVGLLTALTRLSPGSAVLAKILGSFGVSIVVILAGLPALVLAQQAAAVPMFGVLVDLLLLAGLALLVAVSSTASILIARDGLRAWLSASVIVFGVMLPIAAWTRHVSSLGLFCSAAGAAGTLGLCSMARSLISSHAD